MAGEKRTQDQEETLLSETVILVDIEGTTTSISFVKDTLFPYVRENVKKYIETKWADDEFKKDLEKLKEQAKKDEEDKIDGFVPITGANTEEEKESIIKNVLWQMDGDRKTGALKQLQGHIWRDAYDSGAVKAHVFEDVPKALESWTNDGRKVYVYSSGSVEAQKLLFGHSVHGDLLKHFSGYFDTEIGAKQESSSYKNILGKIGVEASSVIFLTDVVKEAQAAKEAGLSTAIVVREGNAALTDEERVAFTTIKSLLDLTFQTSTKRQKLEAPETQETVKKSVPDVSEPMDTSEDVEMTDVSDKKAEKIEVKEVVESEADENPKAQKEAQKPTKTDEPMVTDAKDAPNAEKAMETDEVEKTQTKVPEVSTKPDTENVVQPPSDKTETKSSVPETVTDKSVVSEKVEKPAEQVEKTTESAPAKTTPTVNDPVDGACESKSKPEPVSVTEKKADESTEKKETKSENPTATDTKTVDDGAKKDKNVSNSVEEKKPEECAKPDKVEAKDKSTEKAATNSSTIESPKSESTETSVKSVQEPSKVEEKKPATAETTENGDVTVKDVEKVTAPTITEPEATSSKADAKADVKETPETIVEAKAEKESEVADEKSCKAKDAEEPAATTKEKEETAAVDDAKDKNTVELEKKKLNGTTQNGDTEVPASDDKLHRNGLNEGSSNEKLNSATNENTSAQNGEPESSSEASAESIKVKKVVDSTVSDGAGEPDVVPPVVVAATS